MRVYLGFFVWGPFFEAPKIATPGISDMICANNPPNRDESSEKRLP